MTESAANNLTSGRVLARNTIWNLIGQVAPLLVALFAIPPIIRGLGTDRFGVLTLAWMVIGYFNLFDLGLSRALTKLVAEKLGARQEQEIPILVWTALLLMLFLGLVGTVVVSLLSPWLVRDVLKIPEILKLETLRAFYLLAFSIPVIITATGLRGILEAMQRFDLINAVRIPMGIFIFIGPLLVLPFSKSICPVVGILVVGRLLFLIAHLFLCLYVMPALRHGIALRRVMIVPLLRLGSWMTVSNVVSPLMVYLDRFLIGGIISVAAVAYYATPYEVVTKLLLLPIALVGVLFPAFAASFMQEQDRTALLFVRAIKYLFLILFPVILLIVTLAHEGLYLWLGSEFARNSTRVAQWLAIGVFFNGLAQIPFALVQSAGRPDLTAKLHLIELPLYLIALWWLVNAFGIEGAAIAWMARVVVDTLFLFIMALQLLPPIGASAIRHMAFSIGTALLILALASLLSSLLLKGFFLLLTLIAFTLFAWFLILDSDERILVQNRFKAVNVFN